MTAKPKPQQAASVAPAVLADPQIAERMRALAYTARQRAEQIINAEDAVARHRGSAAFLANAPARQAEIEQQIDQQVEASRQGILAGRLGEAIEAFIEVHRLSRALDSLQASIAVRQGRAPERPGPSPLGPRWSTWVDEVVSAERLRREEAAFQERRGREKATREQRISEVLAKMATMSEAEAVLWAEQAHQQALDAVAGDGAAPAEG